MFYSNYNSPISNIIIASKDNHIIGLWFENQKYFPNLAQYTKQETPIITSTKLWLDKYFNGKNPSINIQLKPIGTPFQKSVWQELLKIPYGKTTTYREIAKIVAKKLNKPNMAPQAIGNAIGHNPISIIIPCHRVIAQNGNLTGYAGGLNIKKWLLEHETLSNN